MTTPVPVTELVTLADVTAHLNLTNDAGLDTTELQGFIDAATAYIQNFTGPIIGQSFTETHNGGGPIICLRNPPVFSMTSVIEYLGVVGNTLAQVNLGDASIGTYSYSVESMAGGLLRRRFNGGLAGSFFGGNGNVVVTYVAGSVAVAKDVRMAVLQDIAGLYNPSQVGANPFLPQNADGAGTQPLNPIGMFPRVAEILSAPVMRPPSIA